MLGSNYKEKSIVHLIYLLNGLKEYPDKLRTSFVGTYRSAGSGIAQIRPETRMAHSILAGQNIYSDSAGRLRPLFCDRLLRPVSAFRLNRVRNYTYGYPSSIETNSFTGNIETFISTIGAKRLFSAPE